MVRAGRGALSLVRGGRSPIHLSLSLYVPTLQTITVLSSKFPADASHLPSRLNATAITGVVWPLSVAVSLPAATSQSLTVPSESPAARILPSGPKDNELAPFIFPSSFAVFLPLARSQR